MKSNIFVTTMLLIAQTALAQSILAKDLNAQSKKVQMNDYGLKGPSKNKKITLIEANEKQNPIKAESKSIDLKAMSLGQDRGGGDLCEDQIKVIRDDIVSWIRKGGPKSLKLPETINWVQYSTVMLEQISKAKIRCVGSGDESFPVEVYGTPKTCRFDLSADKSQITCDYYKFLSISESKQYVLIHHEYAGLSGIEKPNKDDSVYTVSNQISSYLIDQVVKRLAIKPVNFTNPSGWLQLDGAEASNLARSLQEVLERTEFEDCDLEVMAPTTSETPLKCSKEDKGYFIREFGFSSKTNNNGAWWVHPGQFVCGGKLGVDTHFTMKSTSGRPAIRNFIDKNVTPGPGEEKNHLQLDTIYYLDTAQTKIAEVLISKSKIIVTNTGTIGKPIWKQVAVPISSLTCLAVQ